MDVKCRFCGEPLDFTELRDQDNTTATDAWQLFRKHGCGALDFVMFGEPRSTVRDCNYPPIEPATELDAIRARWEFADDPESWYVGY